MQDRHRRGVYFRRSRATDVQTLTNGTSRCSTLMKKSLAAVPLPGGGERDLVELIDTVGRLAQRGILVEQEEIVVRVQRGYQPGCNGFSGLKDTRNTSEVLPVPTSEILSGALGGLGVVGRATKIAEARVMPLAFVDSGRRRELGIAVRIVLFATPMPAYAFCTASISFVLGKKKRVATMRALWNASL